MICRRCLLSRASQAKALSRRFISSTTPNAAQEEPQANSVKKNEQAHPHEAGGQPSATSTASQPFTTPVVLSPSSRGLKPSGKKPSDAPLVQSSCLAGTVLTGLNFIKGKADPIAMEDHEYPDWLWKILEPKKKADEEAATADLFSKSKGKRQKAKKALKGKQAEEGLVDKIPLYEQTIDLPSGDGTELGAVEAAKAREELRKAMRVKRRADIKEDNFLRTMR